MTWSRLSRLIARTVKPRLWPAFLFEFFWPSFGWKKNRIQVRESTKVLSATIGRMCRPIFLLPVTKRTTSNKRGVGKNKKTEERPLIDISTDFYRFGAVTDSKKWSSCGQTVLGHVDVLVVALSPAYNLLTSTWQSLWSPNQVVMIDSSLVPSSGSHRSATLLYPSGTLIFIYNYYHVSIEWQWFHNNNIALFRLIILFFLVICIFIWRLGVIVLMAGTRDAPCSLASHLFFSFQLAGAGRLFRRAWYANRVCPSINTGGSLCR